MTATENSPDAAPQNADPGSEAPAGNPQPQGDSQDALTDVPQDARASNAFHRACLELVLSYGDDHSAYFCEQFFADAAGLQTCQRGLLTELALQLQLPAVACRLAPPDYWLKQDTPWLWQNVDAARAKLTDVLSWATVREFCKFLCRALQCAPVCTLEDVKLQLAVTQHLQHLASDDPAKEDLLHACLARECPVAAARLFRLMLTMMSFSASLPALVLGCVCQSAMSTRGPLLDLCLEHCLEFPHMRRTLGAALGDLPRETDAASLAAMCDQVQPLIARDPQFCLMELVQSGHPLAPVVVERNAPLLADDIKGANALRASLTRTSVTCAAPHVLLILLRTVRHRVVEQSAARYTSPVDEAFAALGAMRTCDSPPPPKAFEQVVHCLCTAGCGGADRAAQTIMLQAWKHVGLQAGALRTALAAGASHVTNCGILWARAACQFDEHGDAGCLQALHEHVMSLKRKEDADA